MIYSPVQYCNIRIFFCRDYLEVVRDTSWIQHKTPNTCLEGQFAQFCTNMTQKLPKIFGLRRPPNIRGGKQKFSNRDGFADILSIVGSYHEVPGIFFANTQHY